jgi:hypothetical protein
MTEHDWLTSEDLPCMLAYLKCTGQQPSDRKLRLWVEACRGATGVEHQEAWVDPSEGDNLQMLVSGWSQSLGEFKIPDMPLRAALLREIVGNPWELQRLQAKWKQELYQRWLTPLVLRLATAIYEDRAFDQMPILSDALEDAGCVEEGLLRHLRGRETCPKCNDEGKYRIYPRDQLAGSGPVYSTCWDCKFTTDRRERPGGGVHLGCGFIDLRGPHVRGCWAVDLILGKE